MIDPRPIDPALEPALARVIDPELRVPIIELDMVRSAVLRGGRADATIALTIVGCPAADVIEREATAALESVVGTGNARVELTVMSDGERAALLERLRSGRPRANQFEGSLARIIAVTSGKGGVGKSTIVANLAASLAADGYRVGVIDADVYGFSIPGQLGSEAAPTRLDDMIVPPVAHGVKVISIGMFVQGNRAVSWRGPMLQRTLKQFLTDVYFGDLDVLLLDMPPGTGDVALTAGQLLPSAEVVVVTTPQHAAATVAVRAGLLADQLGQRVIGVVENLSWQMVGAERIPLFGEGGGKEAADELTSQLGRRIPLLSQIPVSIPVRIGADRGVPAVIDSPDDEAVAALRELATRLVHRPRGIEGKRLPFSPR